MQERAYSADSYDVAVVGYGPVGAVAAGLLARRGHRTVVMDARDDIFPHPRAITLDSDTMRTFQALGAAGRIVDQLGAYLPTEYRGVDGQAIARFMSRPETDLDSWDSNYQFNQPLMEAELRRTIDERYRDRLDVLVGHRLTDLREEKGRCVLAAATADGSRKTISASYVLACDGAVSTIRKLLGIGLENSDFDRPYIVIDADVSPEAAAELPVTNVQYCEPGRPTSYIVGPKALRRWEIMLLPGEDPAVESSPEGLKRHLDRWLPASGYKILRAAAYTFHGLVAREWRQGRVFLLGDAAHQTPPFMGQGMCQGVRDAANLAWKLDLVLRGKTGEALLDTYVRERKPHVLATTRQAVQFGSIICETDPARAAARDRRMREENGVPPRTVIRQSLIPPLEDGLLSSGACDLRGTVVPQPRSASGDGEPVLLDDVSASIRLIVTDPALAELGGAAASRFRDLGGTVVLVGDRGEGAIAVDGPVVRLESKALADWLGGHRVKGVLVRPDNYIFGCCASPAGANALVDEYFRMLAA